MKLSGSFVAMAMGAVLAAGVLSGCDKKEAVVRYDPQIDGFMPHPLSGADASILENQKALYDKMVAAGGGAPKPAATPAPAPAPAVIPEGTPLPAPDATPAPAPAAEPAPAPPPTGAPPIELPPAPPPVR